MLFFYVLDLCDYLHSLPIAHQVFLYRVHKNKTIDDFISCHEDENSESSKAIGTDQLTSNINNQSIVDGYCLTKELYDKAIQYPSIKIDNRDLGITILLLNFARYHSHGQYHLFIDECYNIEELDLFVRQLLRCSSMFVKLIKDLSIHRKYGLKAQMQNYTKNGHMTLEKFNGFFELLNYKELTVVNFIKICRPYHIGIIESLYAFASFTCNTRLIVECQYLHRAQLNVKFDKIQHVLQYNGCAWFDLPSGVTWFASFNNCLKTSNYKTRAEEHDILQKLSNVKHLLIFGVIVDTIVYPLRIDDWAYEGNWKKTADMFKELNLNCIFNFDTTPLHKNAYFVVHNKPLLYKMTNCKK